MKKVLLYRIEEEDYVVLKEILDQKEISTLIIDDACLEETIENLFQLESYEAKQVEKVEDTFMLMQEISREELLEIIKEIKARGKEFESIKVMRTETNASWTLSYLFGETQKEHQIMQKVMILQSVLKSCNDLDFSTMKEESAMELKHVMMDAYLLLQSGRFEEGKVEQITATLMEALRQTNQELN